MSLYDKAYEVYQSIDDRVTVHNEECHGETGQHDPELCRTHLEKLKELGATFRPLLLDYASVRMIFMVEIRHLFPEASAQHNVLGVREGKILVGRKDNARGDITELDQIIEEGPSSGPSIEISLVRVTPEFAEDSIPTGVGSN